MLIGKNQCPKEETEEEEIIEDAPADEPDVDSDMKGMQVLRKELIYISFIFALPEMEKLENLYNQMSEKLEELKKNSPKIEDVNKLKIIQSMDSLLKYKQEMNVLRYNIHKNMSDDYGYDFLNYLIEF